MGGSEEGLPSWLFLGGFVVVEETTFLSSILSSSDEGWKLHPFNTIQHYR
jgi:hypothetical protein